MKYSKVELQFMAQQVIHMKVLDYFNYHVFINRLSNEIGMHPKYVEQRIKIMAA